MKKWFNGGIGIGLEQEDWDFSGCPKGREYDCWCYEFAREVPGLGPLCRMASEEGDHYDEHGNWHGFWGFPVSDPYEVIRTPLVLLRGFPKTP